MINAILSVIGCQPNSRKDLAITREKEQVISDNTRIKQTLEGVLDDMIRDNKALHVKREKS